MSKTLNTTSPSSLAERDARIDSLVERIWCERARNTERSLLLLKQLRVDAEKRGDARTLLLADGLEGIHLHFRSAYDEAVAIAERILATSEEDSSPVSRSIAHYILGMTDRFRFTPEGALERFDAGLDAIRSTGGHRMIEGSLLYSRALAIAALGRREEAISLFREVVSFGKRIDAPSLVASGLYGEAVSHLNLGDYRRAADMLGDVEERAGEEGLTLLLASARQATGRLLSETGQVAAALENELKIAEEWERGEYLRGAGLSLCNAGFLAMTLGSYEQSLHLLSRALDLAYRKDLPDIEAIALQQIAQVYEAVGEVELIIEYYLRSMNLARETNDSFTESVALYFLSRHYQRNHHLARALAGYLRALQLARKAGRRAAESSMLNAIGQIYIASGDHEKAEEALTEALAISREFNGVTELTSAATWLAHLRRLQGAFDEAKRLLQESIEISTKAGLFLNHKEALVELRALADEVGDEEILRKANDSMSVLTNRVFDSATAQRTRVLLRAFEESYLPYHAERLELSEEDTRLVEETLRRGEMPSVEKSTVDDPSHQSDPLPPTTPPEQGIAVTTFGRFIVTRDGKEVPLQAWKRKRARDLFKLLLANHRQVITLDRIEEALWGERVEKLGPLVMNAASHIRSALGLARNAKEGLPHLTREGDGYILDLGEESRIDIFRFKALIVAARHASSASNKMDLYDRALQVAEGPFLPDDRDAEWTAEHRHLMEDAWYEAAEFIAREHLRAGRNPEAITRARAILMRDSTNENGWKILLRALLASGRTRSAREELTRCREAWRDLLDMDVPEEIVGVVEG